MKLALQKCIFAALLMLTGCSCDCPIIPPPNFDGTTTINESVIVYGNACGNAAGTVNDVGDPSLLSSYNANGLCTTPEYWVQVPKININSSTNLSLNISGGVSYCSTGMDCQNTSPTIQVVPGPRIQSSFSDGSNLGVQTGQNILIQVTNSGTDPGVAVGYAPTATNLPASVCGSSDYSIFSANPSGCMGQQGFGLTIYVGSTEIVTLDNTANASAVYYPRSTSRYPNLYWPYMSPANISSFISYVHGEYPTAPGLGNGNGFYGFTVPAGINGVLGFSIARKAVNTTGYGNYTLNVMSTPPACYVDRAQTTDVGQRGALEMIISNANPNDVKNVLNTVGNVGNLTVDQYYQEVINYVNSTISGITLAPSATKLSSMVTNDAPSLSPIIITSPTYSNNISSQSGNIYFKVRDDYYSDNVGNYKVNVTTVAHNSSSGSANFISNFLDSLLTPINTSLSHSSNMIYMGFMESLDFMKIVRVAMIVYIMFLGVQYTLGLTSINAHDLVNRAVKIGVITEMTYPNSWTFFHNYFFNLFLNGNNFIIYAATGDASDHKTVIFSFINDVFNVFLEPYTWQAIAALLPDLIGFIFLFFFIFLMVLYIITIARVFVAYILVLIALALLISLAPLFIVMILFERTRKYFQGWINYLVSYSLQPAIMFIAIFFLNNIFLTLWSGVFSFPICWGGSWPIYINWALITFDLVTGTTKIGCIQWYQVPGGISYYSLCAGAIILYIVIQITQSFITHVPTIIDTITGTSASSGISKVGDTVVQQGMRAAGSAYSMGKKFAFGKGEESGENEKARSGAEISVSTLPKDPPTDGSI